VLATPAGRVLLINLDSSGLLGDGLRGAFADPAKATPAFVNKYVDLSRAPDRRRAWLDLMTHWSNHKYATPQALAGLKVPTLVLWGEKDQLVPLDSGRRFVAAIPGAHLIVYPKVGHLPEEEAAEASAADVGAFLHGLEPAKKAAPGTVGAKAAAPTVQVKPTKNLLVFY
jgi:pimeloyl-ACP methyl ester carboxylesterase